MGFVDFKLGNIIKSVGDAIDSTTTSDEERMEKQNELKKMQLVHIEKRDEEITKRWEADSSSDSRIAKLTRPMLVLYLTIIVTIMAFVDGNVQSFTIKEQWVTLFSSLSVSGIGGYFVLRTYEKRHGVSKWEK